MWTPENRPLYNRDHLRYPSDLTDAEWTLIEPLLPPAKRGGRKRTVNLREVVSGILYVLSTGCQWRAIPKDLPPRSTVFDCLELWSWDGTLDRIHHELYVRCREQADREASPTAAIIDSQSVKSAEKGDLDRPGGLRWRQENQGEEAARRRRHARLPDARHRPCRRHPGPRRRRRADASLFGLFPFLLKLFADGGYQGEQFQSGLRAALAHVQVEIVKRSDRAKGFVVLPKRWIVERTFAWLNRCRRLAKDWENLNRRALTFLRLASIRLMLRRLCKHA